MSDLAKPETGWLLEKSINGWPHWLYVSNGMLNWTSDSLQALRFARREDAEQMTGIVEDCDVITEHQWG